MDSKNKQYGSKKVRKGAKCSYRNCDEEAISYNFSSSYGLNLCKKHGGEEIK